MLDLLTQLVVDSQQEPSQNGGSGIIIAVLAGGGVSAVVAAMVTGFFSKKKLGAEATEIITNAAAGVVTSMQGQLSRSDQARHDDQLRHERAMASMAEAHVKERREWQKVLQLHVAWDVMAIARMAEAAQSDSQILPLPPPPPVTPAQRFVDDNGYPLNQVD